MSERNNGGPAFPSTWHPDMGCDPAGTPPGMSLRDYFAAAALQGLLASGPHDCGPDGLAHDAYQAADAMLKSRDAKA